MKLHFQRLVRKLRQGFALWLFRQLPVVEQIRTKEYNRRITQRSIRSQWRIAARGAGIDLRPEAITKRFERAAGIDNSVVPGLSMDQYRALKNYVAVHEVV